MDCTREQEGRKTLSLDHGTSPAGPAHSVPAKLLWVGLGSAKESTQAAAWEAEAYVRSIWSGQSCQVVSVTYNQGLSENSEGKRRPMFTSDRLSLTLLMVSPQPEQSTLSWARTHTVTSKILQHLSVICARKLLTPT